MPDSFADNQNHNSQLSELIAVYLQQMEAGGVINRKQILSEHPQLADELQEFFNDFDWMEDLAEPVALEAADHNANSLDVNASTFLGGSHKRDTKTDGSTAIREISGRVVGDYELLEEVGRGGMGVIYKARQRSLNRVVALKMILSNRLASQKEVDRFYSEAETVAGLEHRGIVSIFEVGQHEDQHFYSMAFVDGLNLGDLLQQEGLLEPKTAAKLLCLVAEAVAYAHERGIIHRDLKPANILLSPSREREGVWLSFLGTSGYFQPKVTDFGLAKRLESDSELTGTGQVLGTPSYMPPEQAAGDTESIGPLSDVYSLGAVLYCLLTARAPFRSASVMETLQQVLHVEPVPPSQLDPAVPRDLETICLKCLQKNPTRRYSSAQELADDLNRFQEGAPISARPISQLERAWKWMRRRPTAASLIGVGILAVILLVGLAVSYSYQVERERLMYNQGVSLAYQSWRENNIVRAQELLKACPENLRGWEWDYVNRLCETGLLKSIDMPYGNSVSAAYDKSGRFVAVGGVQGVLGIWEVTSGKQVAAFAGIRGDVVDLMFSPDGTKLASADSTGSIQVWDVASEKELFAANDHEGLVWDVAYSPDGKSLVSCGSDGTIRLWDATNGASWEIIAADEQAVKCATFTTDGLLIATAHADGTVQLRRTKDLNVEKVLHGHTGEVNAVAFSPDNLRLASAGSDGIVKLWNLAEHREILAFDRQTGPVRDVKFSPDGRRLATGGQDRTLKIWDSQTGRLMLSFEEPTRQIRKVAFHPDGKQVTTGGAIKYFRIWSVGSGQETRQLEGHDQPVQCVAFHPTRELIVSGGMDGMLKFWNPKSGRLLHEFKSHEDQISEVNFSKDGRLMACASHDHTVSVWRLPDKERAYHLRGHTGDVYGVAFSPDGKWVASAGHDGKAILWDLKSGKKIRTINRVDSPLTCLEFSPDSSLLAMAGWQSIVEIWKVSQDKNPVLLKTHQREVTDLAFSPDGSQIVSGDKEGTVVVWDVRRKRLLASLTAHRSEVTSVVFSPRGERILSTGWDGLVKIWDLRSEHETLAMSSQNGRVLCGAFSPDGEVIASANHNGTITIWGVE